MHNFVIACLVWRKFPYKEGSYSFLCQSLIRHLHSAQKEQCNWVKGIIHGLHFPEQSSPYKMIGFNALLNFSPNSIAVHTYLSWIGHMLFGCGLFTWLWLDEVQVSIFIRMIIQVTFNEFWEQRKLQSPFLRESLQWCQDYFNYLFWIIKFGGEYIG